MTILVGDQQSPLMGIAVMRTKIGRTSGHGSTPDMYRKKSPGPGRQGNQDGLRARKS
jgi:hypothetical protein